MRKINFATLAFCGVIGFSQSLYANGLMQQNNNNNAGSGSNASGSGLVQQAPLPTSNPTMTPTDGLQQNAINAQKKQKQGSDMAMLSALFSAGIAAATCPNPKMQAVCAAALLGAAAAAMAGSKMNNAANKSATQNANVTAGATNPTTATEARNYTETARKITTAAKMAGHQVDLEKGKAKLADGREINLNDLGSPGGLANSGLKPGELKAFGDIMKESMKKAEANLPAMAADGEPGGDIGGGGTQMILSDSSSGGGSSDTARRSPASVTGAMRDYNGTPIGVSVENIFVIVNRRYTHEVDGKKLNLN